MIPTGLLLSLVVTLPGTVDPPGPGIPATATAIERVLLIPDPGATTVAAALHFPVGSSSDPIGAEGTVHLLGRVIEAEGNRRLNVRSATVRAVAYPESLVVTVLTSPAEWSGAIRELEGIILEDLLRSDVVEAARSGLLQVLRFEQGSPVRLFERERDILLRGTTHPAARPPHGTTGSVQGISAEDLAAFRATHLRGSAGRIVLTGALDAADIERALGHPVEVRPFGQRGLRPAFPEPEELPASPGPADPTAGVDPAAGAAALPPPPALRVRPEGSTFRAPATGLLAWEAGDRTVLDRQVTATWMTAAFPFRAGTPEVLLDFLAHLAFEHLNRTPPDPGLYESVVTVEQVRGAPVLVVSASVDPFRSSEWEDRLLGIFDQLADAPPVGAFFELTRRRFRSGLVMSLADPEGLVSWLALRLEPGPAPPTLPDPELELWRLTPEGVAEAARGAGPPRLLVYGPQGLGGP